MSHLAQIQTNIRSLEILTRAVNALGIPIHPTPRVYGWYATFNGQQHADVDIALGNPNGTPRVGFRRSGSGTFEMIADPYDCCAEDRIQVLGRMGPTMHAYTEEQRSGQYGHVATGTPTLLLQEYALQVGEAATRARGMSYVRVPLENGDKLLRITGGSLPPGGCIMLTARADGTSTVAAFNVKGPSCKAATKWLEDVLGTVTDDHLTAEFFHETTRQGGIVHVGP